jgi:hypothetical protein
MPTPAYSLGNKAPAPSAITATNKKLTHQGERNKTAKSDFSDILNFTNDSGQRGPTLRQNHAAKPWAQKNKPDCPPSLCPIP